ncbi:MAG: hypothetical protein ABL930_07860, partial [Pseudobdellovibrio sp.]
LVFTTLSFAQNAEMTEASTPSVYNCSYTLGKEFKLDVHFSPNRSFLVFRSDSLVNPVLVNVLDQDINAVSTTLYGDLPAPWLTGTTFRLQLNSNSPFHVLSFYGPKRALANAKVACVKH